MCCGELRSHPAYTLVEDSHLLFEQICHQVTLYTYILEKHTDDCEILHKECRKQNRSEYSFCLSCEIRISQHP